MFFYHLKLELHSYPHNKASYPNAAGKRASNDVFYPPAGTSIFNAAFPEHSRTSWSSESGPAQHRKGHKRSRTLGSAGQSHLDAPPGKEAHRGHHEAAKFKQSGTEKRGGPLIRSNSGNILSGSQTLTQDWRYGPVAIQSIDMVSAPSTRQQEVIAATLHDADVQGDARPRGKSFSHGTRRSGPGLANKGRFVPSNPKNTEVGWGVVHLYREEHESRSLGEEGFTSGGSSAGSDREDDDQENTRPDTAECTTLCILAVPSYMTPSDLLGFVGEQTREDVSHFRLIRTGRANKYMVLMKFREAAQAKKWQKEWNGKLFNSMEPENCHVVFVKSIIFDTPDNERTQDPSSFPQMSNDPFSPLPIAASSAASVAEPTSSAIALTTKPLAPPPPNLIELPTCPVCLERMDETTGLLTILCQHVFHCACLEKWRGSGCPVCRYTQNGAGMGILGGRRAAESADILPENECSTCGSLSNLWVCLICGNVGCGRYDGAHAFQHYEQTNHTFAMHVDTQHIWDYAGDGYVHRLIQTKTDPKFIDLPASARDRERERLGDTGIVGYANDMVPREKVDNMAVEYTYLLTSQLEGQRSYFEEQLQRAVDKAMKASVAAEKAQDSAKIAIEKLQIVDTDLQELKSDVQAKEKEIDRLQKRADKFEQLSRDVSKKWQEEKTINESLMERVKWLNQKVDDADGKMKSLEDQKKELEEQNRDLSFFISGQAKLQEMGEEVQDGTVEVPEAKETKKRKGKGKAKK